MNNYYTLIAMDIARDRTHEADRHRRLELARAARAGRPGPIRRGLAAGLALVSRGSAAAVGHLDARTSDDLHRVLATGK